MNIRCNFVTSKRKPVQNDALTTEIILCKNKGLSKAQTIDLLLSRGKRYKDIIAAIQGYVHGSVARSLDWRSPTAINQTARMLRNDVRRGATSYTLAMLRLIKARNMLKTMIKNSKKDKRLKQINYEINTTKRLLMGKYGRPEQVRNYHVYGGRQPNMRYPVPM